MIHDEKKKINDKAQKGDRDGVYMCRGETVERDKNNLYGSISEAGEKTIFCTAAFRKNEKSGCYIMQNVCRQYKDKKIVLLIERLDDKAENKEQRIARRKFYLKNGFTSSDIFITGASGEMEIMNFGEKVSEEAYIDLQKYALGTVMFRLSKIKVAEKTPHKKREEADQG